MTRKSGQPRPLASLLPEIAREQGWQRQLDRHRLFLDWDNLVDGVIRAHARPLKIVGNVLWLEVVNSAWMQQLQFEKIRLLETLNATLGHHCLDDIRFTLTDHSKKEEPTRPRVSFVQPDQAECDAFSRQIATVEDQTIRGALMSLWYQSHACRRG